MKKITILFLFMIVITGTALADRGVDPVPETQGIVTSSSIDAVGNFASATEIQWRITDNPVGGLAGIPPLRQQTGIYESIYTEDTQSSGTGLVFYDKELDVETSGQISGQWNIEATKQIAFVGVDGAAIVSSDTIFVDGAMGPWLTNQSVICPFASDVSESFPTYCNRAEAGSTIDMTVANVRTTTTDRFLRPSADTPVELNHDIRVTELIADVPSQGMASAYLDVLIQETKGGPWPSLPFLGERIEFSEESTADGAITLFEKLIHYGSGFVR